MEANSRALSRPARRRSDEEIKRILEETRKDYNETMAALEERRRKLREENPWIYEEAEKFRQEAIRIREEAKNRDNDQAYSRGYAVSLRPQFSPFTAGNGIIKRGYV